MAPTPILVIGRPFARFEGSDILDDRVMRVAGELLNDVVSTVWTLGDLWSGRMVALFENPEQEDAAQVAECSSDRPALVDRGRRRVDWRARSAT